MATMGEELTKNIQFARENTGGTWVGQQMLRTEASEHIACSNMYLVAVERLIKLEDAMELALVLLGHADFKNGNTGPSGVIDEGEVYAGRLMDEIIAIVPSVYTEALKKL